MPLSGAELRACEFRDLDVVTQIEKTSFPKRPYKKRDFLYFLLVAGKGFVVACKEDAVIGYVVAMPHEGEGWIQSIAVSPEFRRKGVGEMLMNSAIAHLSGRFRRLYLFVAANNGSARNLYRKLAFVETGKTIKGYYPDGDDAVEMVRKL